MHRLYDESIKMSFYVSRSARHTEDMSLISKNDKTIPQDPVGGAAA
jgi:hypothetical protein